MEKWGVGHPEHQLCWAQPGYSHPGPWFSLPPWTLFNFINWLLSHSLLIWWRGGSEGWLGDPCSDLPPSVTLPTARATSCSLSALPLYMSRDWGQEAVIPTLLIVSWQLCLHMQAHILLHTFLFCLERPDNSSEVGRRWPECKVERASTRMGRMGRASLWVSPHFCIERPPPLFSHLGVVGWGRRNSELCRVSFKRTALLRPRLPVFQWLGYSERRLELRQRSSGALWAGRALSVPLSQAGCQLLRRGGEGENFPIA